MKCSLVRSLLLLPVLAAAALALSPYDVSDCLTPTGSGFDADGVHLNPAAPTPLPPSQSAAVRDALSDGNGGGPVPFVPTDFNWSQAGHNNAQDGHNPLVAQSDAVYQWFKQQTGGGWMPWGGYPIEGDDYVVFVDHNPGNITCYQKADGSQVWQKLCGCQTYRGRIRPPQPTIFGHNGVSYVCALGYQSAGYFICWRLADGVEMWRTPITLNSGLGAYKARPLYVDGYLYFTPHSEVGTPQPIYKVDAVTGAATVLATRNYECWGGMCTDGSYLYVSEGRSGQARVHKYDIATGSEVAVSQSQGTNLLEIPPSYSNGRIYMGWSPPAAPPARVVCFNASDLSLVWSRADLTGGGYDSQWLSIDPPGGNVYVSPYLSSGYIYALRQSDGSNAWAPLVIPNGRIYNGGLSLTGDIGNGHRLYLTPGYYGYQGSLLVVDADNGTVIQDLTYSGEEMFCGTGRTSNGVLSKTGYGSLYYWNVPGDVYYEVDAGMQSILAPVGTVDSANVVAPRCVIRNKGTDVLDSVNVFFQMDLGTDQLYDESTYVLDLPSGGQETLDFPSWTANARDSMTATAWTWFEGDEFPGDDTLKSKFFVRVRDVAVTDIFVPVDTLDSAATCYPQCQVANHGSTTETFDVQFRIGSYTSTSAVTGMTPGEVRAVTAPDEYTALPGVWMHTVSAPLTGDVRPGDNTRLDTFWVRGTVQHDVAAEQILAPTGYLDTTTVVTPMARVANYGGVPELFWAWFSIYDTVADAQMYRDSLQVSLGGGSNTVVAFRDTSFKLLGPYAARCSVAVFGDQNVFNNVVEDSFTVSPFQRNVALEAISVPSGAVDSGVAVIPRATVRNGGRQAESFYAYFQIEGGYLAAANVAALPPDSAREVTFASWTPVTARDSLAMTAWVYLAGDEQPADDTLGRQFFVHVRDVGATAVIAPVDTVLEGAVINPVCEVRNFGTAPEVFDVEFRIGLYADTAQVTVAPGAVDTATMADPITAQPGVWLDVATTLLSTDRNPGNNVKTDTFWVLGTITHDVGVAAILEPVGTIDTLTTVTPRAQVGNYGMEEETWTTWFRAFDEGGSEVYSEEVPTTLGPGEETVLEFPQTRFTVGGYYTSRCSTFLATDQNWPNNIAEGEFEVSEPSSWTPGWKEMASVPLLPSSRPVKEGGWLAVDGNRTVYAAKGYKTGDFYAYDPIHNTWTPRESIPALEEGRVRPPKKGTCAVSDGGQYIYMVKGNNSLGFWRYDTEQDTWTRLPGVPLGLDGKKVKYGSDVAYLVKDDTGYVYLLKGYKTEFYRFNTESQRWDTLDPVPYVQKPKYFAGSWLCHVPGSPNPPYPFPVLYAHQAKYYNRSAPDLHHNMFVYDVPGDTWFKQNPKGMPLYGLHAGRLRKKTSKDGGSAAVYGTDLYALKGGNTQQFFHYAAARDSWFEMDTMPQYGSTAKRKRVKNGADIVGYGFGAFFALKGNKTAEFWRYVIPTLQASSFKPQARSGVMAERVANGEWRMAVAPNPIASGFATLRYSLPKSGPVTVNVFDVAGRSVQRQTLVATRTGATSIDMRKLANGVYLVRLDADGFTQSQKLVVQR